MEEPLTDPAQLYIYFHGCTHLLTTRAASLQWSLGAGQDVRAVQEAGAVVAIGEDGCVVAREEVDAETATATDIDGDDAQISGRGAANSGSENEGPLRMAAAVAEGEEVGGSTKTKREEAYSCSLVARTQGAVTRKGMAGEDH